MGICSSDRQAFGGNKSGFLEKAQTSPSHDVPRPLFPGALRCPDQDFRQTKSFSHKKGLGVPDGPEFQTLRSSAVIYLLTQREFFYQTKAECMALYDCGAWLRISCYWPPNMDGTIVQAQAAAYPAVLRKALEIPESKIIFWHRHWISDWTTRLINSDRNGAA